MWNEIEIRNGYNLGVVEGFVKLDDKFFYLVEKFFKIRL